MSKNSRTLNSKSEHKSELKHGLKIDNAVEKFFKKV